MKGHRHESARGREWVEVVVVRQQLQFMQRVQ